jgi:hypothetical protein
MEEYSDDAVGMMYELISEFIVDMDNALDQLKIKNERMLAKIKAFMASTGMDAAELARQALDCDAAPADAPEEKPQIFWDEKTGKWTDKKPVSEELDFYTGGAG